MVNFTRSEFGWLLFLSTHSNEAECVLVISQRRCLWAWQSRHFLLFVVVQRPQISEATSSVRWSSKIRREFDTLTCTEWISMAAPICIGWLISIVSRERREPEKRVMYGKIEISLVIILFRDFPAFFYGFNFSSQSRHFNVHNDNNTIRSLHFAPHKALQLWIINNG